MCGYLGNAAFTHDELVSASRSKIRYALIRPVQRFSSQIMDACMDKINTKIPKQVRDDNVWDLLKALPG